MTAVAVEMPTTAVNESPPPLLNNHPTCGTHLRYTVQWSSDDSFGSGSGEAKISATYDDRLEPSSWVTYTIEGVSESERTYVRVMASNAMGFSEPAAAVPRGWSQHEVREGLIEHSHVPSSWSSGSVNQLLPKSDSEETVRRLPSSNPHNLTVQLTPVMAVENCAKASPCSVLLTVFPFQPTIHFSG